MGHSVDLFDVVRNSQTVSKLGHFTIQSLAIYEFQLFCIFTNI